MMISATAVHNILQTVPIAVLSTYGKDSIHSVPVVFAPVDGDVYSPVDGKPKSGRKLQRIVDIERDPRFTLLVQHYGEDWRELWWLRLSGRGEALAVRDQDDAFTARIVTCLRRKYIQYERTSVLDDSGLLLRLTVMQKSAWAYEGVDSLERRFT